MNIFSKTMKTLIITVLLLFLSGTYACSLAPSTELFLVDQNTKSISPTIPTFKVSKISRGKKAMHSCSGLASLKLKLETPSNVAQGYTFEIVKGLFNKIRFSEVPITVSKYIKDKTEFIFQYTEYTNPPIDITLKITAISKSGKKSKAQYLRINHPGYKKPILPTWSQQAN